MKEKTKPKNLLLIIEEYVKLQCDLISELKKEFGYNRDWKYLLDIPKRGQIKMRGKNWSFVVHGGGVRFYRENAIVDMNRNIDGKSSVFDAGRLAEYLESKKEEEVIYNKEVRLFNFETGPGILHELCNSNEIKRIELLPGEIYELVKWK